MSPDDPRHGTYNGYGNLGCRCAACRKANVAEQVRVRARRESTLDPNDPRHGKYSTYTNYRCRCLACRRASADQRAASYARRRVAS